MRADSLRICSLTGCVRFGLMSPLGGIVARNFSTRTPRLDLRSVLTSPVRVLRTPRPDLRSVVTSPVRVLRGKIFEISRDQGHVNSKKKVDRTNERTISTQRLVELTDGCYSGGDSQGLPGFIHPRVLGIPTISFQ